MNYFPMFVDLKNKAVTVFGGNMHAYSKITKLLDFGAKITVINPDIHPKILELNNILIHQRTYIESDFISTKIAVIAQSDLDIIKAIYNKCKQYNVLTNTVDQINYCDFIFPSVVHTKHLCIGVSSGGISPTSTVYFKQKIQDILPTNLDNILVWMSKTRTYIKEYFPDLNLKQALKTVFGASVDLNRPLSDSELTQILNNL